MHFMYPPGAKECRPCAQPMKMTLRLPIEEQMNEIPFANCKAKSATTRISCCKWLTICKFREYLWNILWVYSWARIFYLHQREKSTYITISSEPRSWHKKVIPILYLYTQIKVIITRHRKAFWCSKISQRFCFHNETCNWDTSLLWELHGVANDI